MGLALVIAGLLALGILFVPAFLFDWIDRLASGIDGAGISGRKDGDAFLRVNITPIPRHRHTSFLMVSDGEGPVMEEGSLTHSALVSDET